MRKALVTGITGQDGSYLCELLLSKGYEVHGIVRRSSSTDRSSVDRLPLDRSFLEAARARCVLHHGDLTDGSSLARIVDAAEPDEIYNLGAQSHVRVSFDVPEYTGDATGLGTLRLLEAVRRSGGAPRFYQAGSSEMFGAAGEVPQTEHTPFRPRSPYAAAKVYAHAVAVNYREAYGMFACNGIFFNHESPRRGENFVTRKISLAVARIRHGLQQTLTLGNLEARRDWGYAPDYVQAMWSILQQDEPDDYVLATGESHSVREFCEEAFGHAGLDYRKHVTTDARHLRPTEVDRLVGDASKARARLGWEPRVRFRDLVRLMVDADLERVVREDVRAKSGG